MRRVVLCRPEGPRNVGAALRAALNFGLGELWAVAPKRPSLLVHPEFEQMAHGVEGFKERVRVVGRLEEALADCHAAVGFTARGRDHRLLENWHDEKEAVRQRCSDPDQELALVFGNEVTGLTTEESEQLQALMHIPTGGEHTSLNLAFAVGLVLYDTFQPPEVEARSGGNLVTGSERTYLMHHVRETLGALTTSAPARRDLEASVERLFSQSYLEARDARAWHQLMRALGNKKSPMDYGLDPLPGEAGRHV